jgi:hypothetical protein
MEVSSAIALVEQVIYQPGWRFSATDHTNRFEGAICVRIDYPARDSKKEYAPAYEKEILTYASFPLIVLDCDEEALFASLVFAIEEINQHETREFFRVAPTFWAPFHPHRIDGMRRWQRVRNKRRRSVNIIGDLQFGIA